MTAGPVSDESVSRSTHNPPKRQVLPPWLMAWPVAARVAFISLVSLVLVLALVVGADAAISVGRIHPGVHVGPVDVGGKTREQAAALVTQTIADRMSTPVKVNVAGSVWDVSAASVTLSVDATSLAGAAYEVGRGEFATMLTGRLRAVFGGVEVPLKLSCDDAAIEALATTINQAVGTPPTDASVKVQGADVTLVPPVDGMGVDAKAMREGVLKAFMSDRREFSLELQPLSAAVDESGARKAYEDALKMVSAPVVLYYSDRQWEVPPSTIGGWIDFKRVEGSDPPALEAFVVSEDVSATVLPMVAEVGKPARDASFETANGNVSIIPAEDGLAADAESLSVRLRDVLTGDGERRAELTMRRVEPEITTEEAQGMGIAERISTFTTDYAASNVPRVNNIHILADALDGTLIAPGDTFSFNATIGPRTAEKGYQEANAIVNGKLVPQLGGGICQVGTTIFNTVFFSGLPVVERKNHSQYISHYPTGRDATVSWGGPDFKFKNDTPNWVLISTSYTNSTVTISLYGTNPGYQVTYDTGSWTDVVDPPVREVPDPALPSGSRVIDERGVSGRTIVVVRHVLKGGVEIRTDKFKSVYKPAEEVVRVGTGGPPPSTPTTTTP